MIFANQCKKYDIKINAEYYGKLQVSNFLNRYAKYRFPFIKNEEGIIVKIGDSNLIRYDEYIIASLNDYYNKLSDPSDLSIKEKMLDNYTKLYSLWSEINIKKDENNILELNELYKKISYGLYILGYNEIQL